MATRTFDIQPSTKIEQAARIAEAACQQLGVETVSIYIMHGALFGVGTQGNSFFVDSEDGKLKLHTYVEED